MEIPVPNHAKCKAINHFDDECILYAWYEDGFVNLYFQLNSAKYFVSKRMFQIEQGENKTKLSEPLNLWFKHDDGRTLAFDSVIHESSYFLLETPSWLNEDNDFILKVSGDKVYSITLTPDNKESDQSNITIPNDGTHTFDTTDNDKTIFDNMVAVYRFREKFKNIHFYTADKNEAYNIKHGIAKNSEGIPLNHFWEYEGINFIAFPLHIFDKETKRKFEI